MPNVKVLRRFHEPAVLRLRGGTRNAHHASVPTRRHIASQSQQTRPSSIRPGAPRGLLTHSSRVSVKSLDDQSPFARDAELQPGSAGVDRSRKLPVAEYGEETCGPVERLNIPGLSICSKPGVHLTQPLGYECQGGTPPKPGPAEQL